MIDITLRCVPPSTTAQQAKRVRVVRNSHGRHVPAFYRGQNIDREANTWASLLRSHVPSAPLVGPVQLAIRLVYPHLKATAKRDQALLIPKVSKPDVGNSCKEIEDTLVRMLFLGDDQQVARLVVEKWHGPADQVGIRIQLAPFRAPDDQVEAFYAAVNADAERQMLAGRPITGAHHRALEAQMARHRSGGPQS